MPRYHDLTATLAARVADGDLPPGATLPSVRALALAEGTTATTVARAYRELAEGGVIVVEARRGARVSRRRPPGGPVAPAPRRAVPARRERRPGAERCSSPTCRTRSCPSAPPGATAACRRCGPGAPTAPSLHLRHRDGEYNAPFARGVLAGREPVLVHLWRREQGLLVPPGNPRGVDGLGDLRSLRVVRRPTGTGTRTLLDRLLLDAGIEPESIAGPTVELHLDVALAVATGEADAGLGLRSAATPLGLDFVPLSWEPFQVATTRAQSGGLRPLLDALATTAVAERIAALGGYDIAGAGEIIDVA